VPDQSVIVWDLETVPDLAGFAAANDLVGKSDVEVREAIGDKFPKHIYHSIVCIGALIAHWEPDHWVVDAVGAAHVGERTEKQLITAFCDKIAELSPQLITFNGNSFDLPEWACLESRRGSMAVRWSVITARARSRRSPNTARRT